MVSTTVRLLGGFAVQVDDRTVGADAFARRGAARLVQLLALAPGRRIHREQVMDALWPEAEPYVAANKLHKAAHYARRTTGVPDAVVLRNEAVALFPGRDLTVDVAAFEEVARAALASGDRTAAESALALYDGDLLPDEPYAAWAFQPRQRVALLRRELLRATGRWAELVGLDATDEQAHLGLAQAMLAAGDRPGALRQLDLLEQVLRDELGIGLSPEAYDLRVRALDTPVAAPARDAAPRYAGLGRQTIRLLPNPGRGPAGVRHERHRAALGEGLELADPPRLRLGQPSVVALVAGAVAGPPAGSLRRARLRVIGLGLSTTPRSPSMPGWAIWRRWSTRSASNASRCWHVAGRPIAVTYAARHPERVSHLVIYGTCARATWAKATEVERRELAALGELIRLSWGSDQPGFRQVYDARFLPDGPLETWRAFDELQRRTTSAANAHRLWKAFGSLDVTELAMTLDVPTLILHSRGDLVWSFAEAEELHALIAGSRLVPLESRNHILQAGEPAFAAFVSELRGFLAT